MRLGSSGRFSRRHCERLAAASRQVRQAGPTDAAAKAGRCQS
jgi:hypothetical protein